MEAREASRDAKSLAAWISPPPRLEVTAAATSSHVGLAQRQRKVTAPSHGNPLHATPRGQGFVSPKSPTRSSCANRAHLAHVHQANHVEGGSQSAAPGAPCALEPTAGTGGAGGRSQAPRRRLTCAHEGRRVPGAGRQWGQKRAPGIVHLRRAEQARDSVEEQSRRPAGPGWRAPRAADTVHRPPARLSPRSRPAAPPTSELQAPRQPPARWREGPERQ